MAPTSGFYAIYDAESQGVKLVDDQGFEEVKSTVTSGRPNIDSIDYERCREIMRFRPVVVRRRPLSPPKPKDLIAVYEPSNQSIIAITRADYEKNKSKYDQGPPPTLKPRAAAAPEPAPTPVLTPAFTDAAPAAEPKPASAKADAQNFTSLIFQPPKIGPVVLSPEDLVAVYDPATQSVIAVKRSQYESGIFSAPKPIVSEQRRSDLIFQAPKVGAVKLCPDDLLAVYHAESQGVILVTRKQYDQGDIKTPAKLSAQIAKPAVSAPSPTQQTANLIFQPPKVGPIKLCPNDLLAVYQPESQEVVLVTRKQYDAGVIPPATPKTFSGLIFQPPKVGPIKLCPDDLLAVYQPETQEVVLVTRKEYDAGVIPPATPKTFSGLIFQPPKVGPIKLCPDDLLAVYQPELQEVVLVTRRQYDAGVIPAATPQNFSGLIFQPPKVGPVKLCPNDLLAVYQPESQEVVLVTRKQYDAGEIPSAGPQNFTNLIFQPPKVGPVELGDDDLIAIYEPKTQSVTTVTRIEFNQM